MIGRRRSISSLTFFSCMCWICAMIFCVCLPGIVENGVSCHGKVLEFYYQISVRTVEWHWIGKVNIQAAITYVQYKLMDVLIGLVLLLQVSEGRGVCGRGWGGPGEGCAGDDGEGRYRSRQSDQLSTSVSCSKRRTSFIIHSALGYNLHLVFR